MSAFAEALRAAAAADLHVVVDGDSVRVQAPQKPASELVERLRNAKPYILNLHWQHGKRLHQYAARYPAEVAQRMAFNVIVTAWHTTHGRRPSAAHCAGCHAPIGQRTDIVRQHDGTRIHDTDECLTKWGQQWRTAAAEALARIGISRPSTWEP
jgi:hypothetical protein